MEGMNMKSKSIRILSVLILLLSIVVLGDGFRGFKDGWNSAGRDLDEKSEGKIHRVDVSLTPTVTYSLPDTLQLADNRKIPYQIGNVALGVKTEKVYELFSGIIGLVSTPVFMLLIIWAGLLSFILSGMCNANRYLFIRMSGGSALSAGCCCLSGL